MGHEGNAVGARLRNQKVASIDCDCFCSRWERVLLFDNGEIAAYLLLSLGGGGNKELVRKRPVRPVDGEVFCFYSRGGLAHVISISIRILVRSEMATPDANSTIKVSAASMVRLISIFTAVVSMTSYGQDLADSATVARTIKQLKLTGISMRSSAVDNDFTDLVLLKRTLEPVQLILLGEQSHGEGSVFSTKVRLIKFLHENMGFDILAFESSFFACAKAQDQISAGENASDVAPMSIYPLWSQTAEVRPLFEYIEVSRKTNRPLILAGFDSRMVPFAGSPSLTRELEKYLHRKNSSAVRESSWSSTSTTIDSLLKREREYNMTQAHWDSLARGLDIIRRDLQSSSSTDMDSRFWLKVLDNVSATSEFLRIPLANWKRLNSVRDRQLADNLLWLLNVRYPGKKIIAWTASYHAARRLPEIHFSGMAPYDSVLTMGDTLYSALGSRLYSVAFTGYSGSYSDWAGQPKSVDSAATGSLEDIMNRTGFERAFFDLRGQPKDTDLARSEFFARPMGYSWRPAIWPHHFDAIVFDKRIAPSTRVSK